MVIKIVGAFLAGVLLLGYPLVKILLSLDVGKFLYRVRGEGRKRGDE